MEKSLNIDQLTPEQQLKLLKHLKKGKIKTS